MVDKAYVKVDNKCQFAELGDAFRIGPNEVVGVPDWEARDYVLTAGERSGLLTLYRRPRPNVDPIEYGWRISRAGAFTLHSIFPEFNQPVLDDQFAKNFAPEAAASLPNADAARQAAEAFVQSRCIMVLAEGIRERVLDKTVAVLMTMGFRHIILTT